MGLDVGIIKIQYLPRPTGHAYEFAWELAIEAGANGYMHGEGNNWGGFSQRQVLRMLDEFAVRKQLDAPARTEIIDWLRSLPWDDWQDDLVLHNTTDDEDDDSILDYDPERHGGLIELHFNW